MPDAGSSWIIWLGVIGSIVGILAALIAWRKAIQRLAVRFATSARRWLLVRQRSRWKEVPPRIARAERNVDVLQTWIPNLRGELDYWRSALQRGAEIRVLLCDQRLVPLRLRLRDKDLGFTLTNVSDLKIMARDFNRDAERIRARFYHALPFGPIYRIDDRVYWGLYYAHQDALHGPAFSTDVDSKLGQLILGSFEACWESGSSRSGDLVLPGTAKGAMSATRSEKEVWREIGRLRNKLRLCPAGRDYARAIHEGGALFVRHAETDLNESEIIAGHIDVGINADGRSAALELAERLRPIHWTRLLSSPLRRAWETARVLLEEREERIDQLDELRERGMGDVEGMSKARYADNTKPRYVGVDLIHGFNTKADGGESYQDVFWRILPLLDEVVEQVGDGARILVCTHEGPMRMIDMAFQGLDPQAAVRRRIGNCSVSCYVPAWHD